MIAPSQTSSSAVINAVTPNPLLATMPGINLSGINNLGSVSANNEQAANILQQSLLLNHPEFSALINLHQQQQTLQQAQQLSDAVCNNLSDPSQQQALMSAAVAAIGFPFFGIPSQFLPQHQLEQLQKVYISVIPTIKKIIFYFKLYA